MKEVPATLLCFGAHPDDVEIGMGGTILKHTQSGDEVIIVDLTLAELSSNGTVTTRQQEAKEAARLLGVKERINLQFPDRGLQLHEEMIAPIVQLIRRYRPQVVFAPHDRDRHPDHRQCSRLIQEAAFNANIRKYDGGQEAEPAHKVERIYYYDFNEAHRPDVVVDITEQAGQKKEAMSAYRSQFRPNPDGVQTRLNTGYLEVIEGRDRVFGKMADVTFAEGFIVHQPLLVQKVTDGL